jgi:hypothetical protein
VADETITRLPVAFKAPPSSERPQLEIARCGGECDHKHLWIDNQMTHVTYKIREGETEVECSGCSKRLDPMWVIRQLAHKESRFRESAKRYQEELERLNERERTKCQHCGKMTRISRS